MSLVSFFKLVEINTKVASIIPFMLGTLFAVYRFNSFNMENLIFMFIALFTFDMATTAINNYIDYKKAKKTNGYNYETHNAIVKYNMKDSTVRTVIAALLLVAAASGFMLFLNTNIIVLILGIISFIIGILYSYGPIPISRMPLGEIFSGFFMGFVIIFISVYIHVYQSNIISMAFHNGVVNISLNLIEIIYIFLISVPSISGIANIMLANNICDVNDDLENKRYTLPVYIGVNNALKVYKILYYGAYMSVILMIILKVEPIVSVITLITFFPVNKNIRLFYERQSKKETFITAVKNFVMINFVQIIAMGIAILI